MISQLHIRTYTHGNSVRKILFQMNSHLVSFIFPFHSPPLLVGVLLASNVKNRLSVARCCALFWRYVYWVVLLIRTTKTHNSVHAAFVSFLDSKKDFVFFFWLTSLLNAKKECSCLHCHLHSHFFSSIHQVETQHDSSKSFLVSFQAFQIHVKFEFHFMMEARSDLFCRMLSAGIMSQQHQSSLLYAFFFSVLWVKWPLIYSIFADTSLVSMRCASSSGVWRRTGETAASRCAMLMSGSIQMRLEASRGEHERKRYVSSTSGRAVAMHNWKVRKQRRARAHTRGISWSVFLALM